MAEEESDAEIEAELAAQLPDLAQKVEQQELAMMLQGDHDDRDAIVTINPGAGGTESQDWASMLFRMYLRWCGARGYEAEVIDNQPGDQAGIKGATIAVNGASAYGYLRSESGIHRLVRISPFDSSGRRHTSFAAVYVTPDLDDSIQVEIAENELRVDTFRSGGPGGQHANMTDSAVRMTHLPTGIFVVCRNERSQHKNRATALRVLKSRLYAHYQAEQEAELAKRHGEKKRDLVRQPDTLLCVSSLPHGEGSPHQRGDGQCERRYGRQLGHVHRVVFEAVCRRSLGLYR